MTNFPVTLPGYQIADSIYDGSRTLVYRAVCITDQQSVIIKVLRNPHPHFHELVGFRNQYIITCHLEHPHIVQPLALERYGNGYALIMPDKEMIALPDYWQKSKPNLNQVLSIVLQLTDVLHYLIQQRIIHKDIKPANILIHPQTQQVELIDFSIASLLPKEQQQLVNPNVLEGALAYISPEQTGRMNRGIDYRTDFYSLGVTFYELLYGELPFISDDPMELIHCHIAQAVQFPSNRDIPEVLQRIVLKLMAKNAEERYQSALGLKYDLERCLQALETTGEIADFALGARDICDRLTIPDKLYGRDLEVQTLLDAFVRVTSPQENRVATGNTEMMLVAGFSGIGKTAVMNEIHKPILKQRGYFIKGKFDQFNRNVPLSAFVGAFRDLMEQLLSESDAQLIQWRNQILDAVGENGQVLIEVIPELEQVIGKQPPVPELSGTAAQNRFNLLFQKFVSVLTTVEHPLVLFLDDLQWADSTSLQLIKLLMEEQGYLLLLGAYRNNEVSSTHPFMVMVEDIKKQQMRVNTITLPPLGFDDTNQLIADTLKCSLERSQPLTRLMFRKTQGNPFFTKQFLKALHEDGQITFNDHQGYWECDIAQVSALSLTENVVEFMAQQIQKLPQKTQRILTLGACIGNQFDLATLAIISEQSQMTTATALWKALQEGLILPMNQTYKFFQAEGEEQVNLNDAAINLTYRFLHDRIQQAAYTLIPEKSKKKTHTTIGKLLLGNTPLHQQNERIFDIVSQLNHGIDSLEFDSEKEQLIHLNLQAGTKAQESTAYTVAGYHFNLGIKLLEENCWDTQYTLSLALYEKAAEIAFITGDFESMQVYIQQVLENANSTLDKIKIYEVTIQAYIAQNQPLIAVETALQVLQDLGEKISLHPAPSEIDRVIRTTKQALKGKEITQLTELPLNDNPQKRAIIQILTNVHPAIFFAAPQLIPIEICTRTTLCLQYGNSPESAHTYADYGLLLCGVLGDIETGYTFGELALAVAEKFPLSGVQARAKVVTYLLVSHWKKSLRSLFIPLKIAYRETLESGDVEFAGYGAFTFCTASFLAGQELTELSKETAFYSQAIAQIHQETILCWNRIYQQTASNLIQAVKQPWILAGDYYNEHQSIPKHYEASEFAGLFMAQTNKLMLAYLLENYEAAYEYTHIAEQYTASVTAMLVQPYFFFYDSLLHLEYYSSSGTEDKQLLLERVNGNQEKMKQWGHHCPVNYLHKYHLVEARKYQIFKQYLEAIEFYTLAISEAKENEYIQEEALANELIAKLYLDWGQEKAAQGYMQEAYYCYTRWGAKAKTQHLEDTYPQLLTPILQQPTQLLTLNHSQTSTQTIHTVSIASSVLDLNSAIKASQILSEEIALDALLSKWIRIIIEHSGATKATLILNNSDTWVIVAQWENDNCDLLTISLEQSQTLPLSIINTVRRTQKAFLINDVEQDNTFVGDPYFIQQQPHSLFCMPILHQGKFIGILYLENHLVPNTFTSERISVINLLTAQAAISLENARLYRYLEDYSHNLEVQVNQRTQQLQAKIQQLQRTQAQLIQAEKMSALGQMVAGIAHEMNNPISFIYGNLIHANDYFNRLMGLLMLYQKHYPQPHPDISQTIEDIELNFLKEDFYELLKSMQVGTERIKTIIQSLRTFSRLDESEVKMIDLHEGIESTLTLLQARLRSQSWRSEIQVNKDYGDLPNLNCYAGQMNQVFMSLLSNAMDAIEEKLRKNNSETAVGIISIQTKMTSEQQIMISIRDNGIGMAVDVVDKVFDPFFTTKEVGKGTGLGMAIAHQIITDKHRGAISCLSELGKGTTFMLKIPL